MKQWYVIKTKEKYKEACKRFEEIHTATKESPHYKEMLLLAMLINQYEETLWDLPEADPVETIKIRMEEFGLQPADLASAYGSKRAVSKMLNYKQPLSLNMIRLFSKMLRIPADALIREYKLDNA